MHKYTYLPAILLAAPFIASAQVGTFQGFFANVLLFIQSTVMPLLLGIGFLFMVINMVRYFIIGGSSEEGREKAKSLATYGVGAFVFLLVFWGIVNMLVSSIGLVGCTRPMFDYYFAPGSNPVTGATGATPAPCWGTATDDTDIAPAGPGPAEDSENGGGDYGAGTFNSPEPAAAPARPLDITNTGNTPAPTRP